MLQIKAMNEVRDNVIVINGTVVGKLTDTQTQQLLDIISGFNNTTMPGKTADKLPNLNYGDEEPSKTKKPYVPKDFKPQYEIVKRDNIYCISRKNGWTKAEKTLANRNIKALKDIIEIDVPFTTKNGKESTFKAWGYKTKKTAEKMLATLPKVITAEEQQKFYDELNK